MAESPETPTKLNLNSVEARDLDEFDPRLKAVGYELRPEEMRPSVWQFDPDERMNRHYHEEQEELYHVLSGRFVLELGESGEEEMELEAGDVTVVAPETVRQLRCVEPGEVFVVGAPPVKDDGVVLEHAGGGE
ncbi:cupin domain-containing protein [Halobium salinum]|uniref:Cupin domain-containing protein n=1 Tax=Halobium salinum TaxID=1364940 RepID=A0ABD5PAF0_9EURY|nr:cupin domain-containing protein [Halobium salinum]